MLVPVAALGRVWAFRLAELGLLGAELVRLAGVVMQVPVRAGPRHSGVMSS